MCVTVCISLCTLTQHRIVLTMFPPNLQTIIIALTLSIEGEGNILKVK